MVLQLDVDLSLRQDVWLARNHRVVRGERATCILLGNLLIGIRDLLRYVHPIRLGSRRDHKRLLQLARRYFDSSVEELILLGFH